MDIFSQKDYYPRPSPDVITYNSQPVTRSRRSIAKADIFAIITYLSSPVDVVDYTIFSDFFLLYRNFISPLELHNILILRFKWCVSETLSKEPERQRIGRIAIVRTFVLLRHTLLNHFFQDFLPNRPLRMRFIKFLNEDYSASGKAAINCIVTLKKLWMKNVKLSWDNVTWNEPSTNTAEDWLRFRIRDITELTVNEKRNGRLSFYAMEGSSSPDFRNRSIISLYKRSETFILPIPDITISNSAKNARRTPSTLLYPQNNSNTTAELSTGEVIETGTRSPTRSLNGVHTPPRNAHFGQTLGVPPSSSPNNRKFSYTSIPTNMSSVMKDVRYPSSPEINKIVPPTPAKKVEFILNALYDPEDDALQTDFSLEDLKPVTKTRTVSSASSYIYKGTVGLLAKWVKNHRRSLEIRRRIKSEGKQDSSMFSGYTRPEMDTFVKYVISISSLDQRRGATLDGTDLSGATESKFDILSARVIDEVEYLISVENKLLQQFSTPVEGTPKAESALGSTICKDTVCVPNTEFSAMDNLDLYQTVNSIAQSVLSLSNKLNERDKNLLATPTRMRRKIHSLSDLNYSSTSGLGSIVSTNFSKASNGSPQRLIFHDSGSSSELNEIPSTPRTSATKLFSAGRNAAYSQATSPLKNVLPILNESSATSSPSTSTTYEKHEVNPPRLERDSLPPEDSLGQLNVTSDESSEGLEHTEADRPKLRTKNSVNNLREFTFEHVKSVPASPLISPQLKMPLSGTFDTSTQSYVLETLNPGIDDSLLKDSGQTMRVKPPIRTPTIAEASISPASGRISIRRRQASEAAISKSASSLRLSDLIKDPNFVKRDNILLENEKKIVKLDEDISKLSSGTPSIATSNLFGSGPTSPSKLVGSDINKVQLSAPPSIRSVSTDPSFSSESKQFSETIDIMDGHLKKENEEHPHSEPGTNVSVNNSKNHQGHENNRYFYNPNMGSFSETSPAKDVELLKNKFLDQGKKRSTSGDSSSNITTDSYPSFSRDTYGNTNTQSELDLNSFPQEKLSNTDPLTIAMLKLEGKYVGSDHGLNGEVSQDNGTRPDESSFTANETQILAKTPTKKRRSMLIERRRQTVMDIPLSERSPKWNAEIEKNRILLSQIQNLMAGYEINDSNLLITNRHFHVPFILMYDSTSIAKQMTLIERELLNEIDWKDLLELKIEYKGPSVTSWLQLLVQSEVLTGIDLAIARFNLTVSWIISEIVLTEDIKIRRSVIQRFIHIADHCKTFQNYNTLMEIVLALNSNVVQKMISSWRLVEPGDLLVWEDLKNIPSLSNNYQKIRTYLNNLDPLKGCIPFIVVYLSDLALNSQKRTWIKEGKIVNYNKFDTNVQIVKHFIQRVQWSKYYDIEVDHELLSKCVYISTLSPEEIEKLAN